MAYIQISKPVGPQKVAWTMITPMTSTPTTVQCTIAIFIKRKQQIRECTSHSIFDVPASDDNKDFGNLSFNHSNEDDSFSVDLNVEKELNRYFGLIATPSHYF